MGASERQGRRNQGRERLRPWPHAGSRRSCCWELQEIRGALGGTLGRQMGLASCWHSTKMRLQIFRFPGQEQWEASWPELNEVWSAYASRMDQAEETLCSWPLLHVASSSLLFRIIIGSLLSKSRCF